MVKNLLGRNKKALGTNGVAERFFEAAIREGRPIP
jgi:hypothetical protein